MPRYNPSGGSLPGDGDPARTGHQFLEDLSTAYWYSEVLFSALELKLFDHIEEGDHTLSSLASAALFREAELGRLLTVMARMELVGEAGGRWYNSQAARRFLVEKNPEYMGDFFLYRRYMRDNWQTLASRIAGVGAERRTLPSADAPYEERNFNYVRALDALARRKAGEIAQLLSSEPLPLPILDLGGGAGAVCRTLLKSYRSNDGQAGSTDLPASMEARLATGDPSTSMDGHPGANDPSTPMDGHPGTNEPSTSMDGQPGSSGRSTSMDGQSDPFTRAVLFDLPEVIDAARGIYPDEDDWDGIETVGGDFRSHDFSGKTRFGLIVISNFLHAYGKEGAGELLEKATGLLKPGGRILVHDYFPDRVGAVPFKGPVYDLAMMLNTYDGACHRASWVVSMLRERGLSQVVVKDLETDSSVILAGESLANRRLLSPSEQWAGKALSVGFRRATPIPVGDIVTALWVRKKCRYGCDGYGKSLMCPPNGMDDLETARMLASYTAAILVEGAPPGREFHFKLLELEKKAFLSGFHKAFVFGAGPCTVCRECPGEGECRHTDLARPAMEASGIDVYETAKNAGLSLVPVKEKGQYIKYIGLLLLE